MVDKIFTFPSVPFHLCYRQRRKRSQITPSTLNTSLLFARFVVCKRRRRRRRLKKLLRAPNRISALGKLGISWEKRKSVMALGTDRRRERGREPRGGPADRQPCPSHGICTLHRCHARAMAAVQRTDDQKSRSRSVCREISISCFLSCALPSLNVPILKSSVE